MEKLSRSFILGFVLALIVLPSLDAQTASSVPAANPTPTGQAPDEVMKKLSDLVHAGKYAEAQQLTAGLLLAYPEDQRLAKAKTLLDKSLASPKLADPAAKSNPPASNLASVQPEANVNATRFTGMDKVDYNGLIELARQAQQSTDLEQQKASLRQFMTESSAFLQKHPDELLMWQIRAASAISLDDPDAGYEAGQELLTAGAADSNDPNLQQMISKLKIKGWLDKQKVEDYKKYGWMLGTWSTSVSHSWKGGHSKGRSWQDGSETWSIGNIEFSKSASGVEGYYVSVDGVRNAEAAYRGTILDLGEIRWEHKDVLLPWIKPFTWARDPSGWKSAVSWEFGSDKRTMKMVFPSALSNVVGGVTLLLTRIDTTH